MFTKGRKKTPIKKNVLCSEKRCKNSLKSAFDIKLHCKDTATACNLSKTEISLWIYLMLAIKISHNHLTDNFIPRIINQISRFGKAVAQRCCVKKVFLEISQNSQKNTCATVSILLKKRLCHRCFPVNFVKFLRTSFLQNTSGRLLLW